MITVLLSSGHGAMVKGEYQTAGKRSPVWDDGTVLYEGEFNRAVKCRVMELLAAADVPYIDINPEHKDIRRKTKINRANKYSRNSFLIEIHANAGGGKGCETFISPNASWNSKHLADIIMGQYALEFPAEGNRGVKEKAFDIIHDTFMPAALIECFFMDNERECKEFLMCAKGRDRIAQWIFKSIVNYIKTRR